MQYNWSISINPSDFEKKLLAELRKITSAYISNVIKKIRPKLRSIIAYHLINSPEYDALTDLRGKLRLDLGIENPETIISQLIDYISNQINFLKKDPTATSLGGMTLYLLRREGLEGLINSPLGSYTSKGGEIPWLKWLLTEGTSTIIQDYEVRYYDKAQKNSRSRFALMVQPTKLPSRARYSKFYDSGGNFTGVKGFSIDSEYAGTEDDNWITRSFSRAIPSINELIEKEGLV